MDVTVPPGWVNLDVEFEGGEKYRAANLKVVYILILFYFQSGPNKKIPLNRILTVLIGFLLFTCIDYNRYRCLHPTGVVGS